MKIIFFRKQIGRVSVDVNGLHLEECVPKKVWFKLGGVKQGEIQLGFIAKDFGEESSSDYYSTDEAEDYEEEEEPPITKSKTTIITITTPGRSEYPQHIEKKSTTNTLVSTGPSKTGEQKLSRIRKQTTKQTRVLVQLPPERSTVEYCIGQLKNTANVSSIFLAGLAGKTKYNFYLYIRSYCYKG